MAGGQYIILLKDSISGIRLLSSRVVSEKADYIEPILQGIHDLFGQPLAVIRDMGKDCTNRVTGWLNMLRFCRNERFCLRKQDGL